MPDGGPRPLWDKGITKWQPAHGSPALGPRNPAAHPIHARRGPPPRDHRAGTTAYCTPGEPRCTTGSLFDAARPLSPQRFRPLYRSVHWKPWQLEKFQELHRQPVGGGEERDAREGAPGHLALLRAARLSERHGRGRQADYRAEPRTGADHPAHVRTVRHRQALVERTRQTGPSGRPAMSQKQAARSRTRARRCSENASRSCSGS